MAYKYQKEVLIMQYGRVCSLCKRKLKKKEVTAHHIIPKSEGGSSDVSNLCICCEKCQVKIHKHKYGSKEYSDYTTQILKNLGRI